MGGWGRDCCGNMVVDLVVVEGSRDMVGGGGHLNTYNMLLWEKGLMVCDLQYFIPGG